MCAAAIAAARIARLCYGAPDPKSGGVEHGARVFAHRQAHHRPEVFGGIAEREFAALLRAFFSERRCDSPVRRSGSELDRLQHLRLDHPHPGQRRRQHLRRLLEQREGPVVAGITVSKLKNRFAA